MILTQKLRGSNAPELFYLLLIFIDILFGT